MNPYVYDVEKEYDRFCAKYQDVQKTWRISNCNENFAICPTYPEKLMVPSTMEDKDISRASEYRSRGRIPILSYVHPNGATLTRCAQPKKGLTGRKSKADIEFASALVEATPHSHGFFQFHFSKQPQKNN